MTEQQRPGPDPLDGLLGQLEPGPEPIQLEPPAAGFEVGFAAGFGQEPAAQPAQPEMAPKGKGRGDPYRVSVIAVHTGITPGTYLRCQAFWAAVPRRDRAHLLTPEQQLCEYLDTVTYQHALQDEQRPEGERLYDWEELHMQGLRIKIQAEMDAIRAQVAQETAQGTRDTIVARLALLDLPENLKAQVLTAIQEVGNLELSP